VNFFGHLSTVLKHKYLVMKGCFRVGLIRQGITHDLSKFSWTEFRAGVMYYQGTRSPNVKEREIFGYSSAWMHHKGRNRHHFEYWTDFSTVENRYLPVAMPPVYFVEMLCDRISASRVYKGAAYTDRSALEYWLHEKDHVDAHPDTAADLEHFLTLLAEKGEKAFFAALRSFIKKRK